MDLATLINIQITSDEKRGFRVRFSGERERVAQLIRDLIGLFGEIGEFSNLIKKIELRLDRPEYEGPSLAESQDQLCEELVDSLIYLMRIAAILGIDLESGLMKKMKINQERYKSLERG